MKIVFFMLAGTIEWGVPEDAQKDFVFATLVSNVRSSGFFMAPDLYLRHDSLIGMAFVPSGGTAPSIVAGMTKQ